MISEGFFPGIYSLFINFLLKVSLRWGAAVQVANGIMLWALIITGITDFFYLPLGVLIHVLAAVVKNIKNAVDSILSLVRG